MQLSYSILGNGSFPLGKWTLKSHTYNEVGNIFPHREIYLSFNFPIGKNIASELPLGKYLYFHKGKSWDHRQCVGNSNFLFSKKTLNIFFADWKKFPQNGKNFPWTNGPAVHIFCRHVIYDQIKPFSKEKTTLKKWTWWDSNWPNARSLS